MRSILWIPIPVSCYCGPSTLVWVWGALLHIHRPLRNYYFMVHRIQFQTEIRSTKRTLITKPQDWRRCVTVIALSNDDNFPLSTARVLSGIPQRFPRRWLMTLGVCCMVNDRGWVARRQQVEVIEKGNRVLWLWIWLSVCNWYEEKLNKTRN